MPEVKETVFPLVTIHTDESRSWEWAPETHEEIRSVTPDGKILTTVQPKGERKPVDLSEPDA